MRRRRRRSRNDHRYGFGDRLLKESDQSETLRRKPGTAQKQFAIQERLR